jgi:hypothetical protein
VRAVLRRVRTAASWHVRSCYIALARYVRSHRTTVAVTVLMAALTVNAGVQAGSDALLMIALAAAGCVVSVAGQMWLAGTFVVKHARKEAASIEARHGRKELTR